MMLIHTVAAGGGSVLHLDGSRLTVGPDSAGADPGPARYGNGGPASRCGRGRYSGGDDAISRVRFAEEMTVNTPGGGYGPPP